MELKPTSFYCVLGLPWSLSSLPSRRARAGQVQRMPLSPTVPYSCAWLSTVQQRHSSSELKFWDLLPNTWGETQELWLQVLALPQSPCCNWGNIIAMIPFPICWLGGWRGFYSIVCLPYLDNELFRTVRDVFLRPLGAVIYYGTSKYSCANS